MSIAEAEQLLGKGREAFEEGDFATARSYFDDALRIDENDESCRNLLAMTLVKLESYGPAIDQFKKLLAKNPNEISLLQNLGAAYIKSDDLTDALKVLQRAAEIESGNAATHSYLGMAYSKKKLYEKAIVEFKKAGNQKMVDRMKEKISEKIKEKSEATAEFPADPNAPPPEPADAPDYPVDPSAKTPMEPLPDFPVDPNSASPAPESKKEMEPLPDFPVDPNSEEQSSPEQEEPPPDFPIDPNFPPPEANAPQKGLFDTFGLDLPIDPNAPPPMTDFIDNEETDSGYPDTPAASPAVDDLHDDDDDDDDEDDDLIDDSDHEETTSSEKSGPVSSADQGSTREAGVCAGVFQLSNLGVNFKKLTDGPIPLKKIEGGGLICKISDNPIFVRDHLIAARIGEVKGREAKKVFKGKELKSLFGGKKETVYSYTGKGALIVYPNTGFCVQVIELDGQDLYLQEQKILAFDSSLTWQNGRLQLKGYSDLDLVFFSGAGSVAVMNESGLTAFESDGNQSVRANIERVVGWVGKISPELVKPDDDGDSPTVNFNGKGVVLL